MKRTKPDIPHMDHNEQGKISTLLKIYNENGAGGDVNSILAAYLLQNAARIKNLSAGELASECHVDRSSVHRFCRLCGYGSFRGLKQAFSVYPETYALPDKGTMRAYADTFFGEFRKMGDELSLICTPAKMEAYARRIHDAPQVTLICHDSSIYTCMKFQLFMVSAGKIVRLLHRQTEEAENFADDRPEDLIITCSLTGFFAREGIRLSQNACAEKMLVTTDHSGEAAEGYDTVLYLSKSDHTSGKTVYSTYAAEIFFDLLFQAYAGLYAAV